MTAHERRYQAALSQLDRPDLNWRCFLWLMTGYRDGALWNRITSLVRFDTREVLVENLREKPWSSSERVFVDLALAMFLNEPLMLDLRDFRVLDSRHWRIVVDALEEYRLG